MEKQKKQIFFLILIVGLALTVVGSTIRDSFSETPKINRFESLPEKPDDFYAYTREVWGGGLTDLCDIDESYWKQPEFYSSWENAKKAIYDTPSYTMWGVYGHGNTPTELSYTINNLGTETIEFCTFFHNGFGVWTYQGFELVPIGEEYFDLEISPNLLTMSPTFPVFEDGWTQKITIKATPKYNLSSGIYTIGYDIRAPDGEYARKKNKEILNQEVDKELYKSECIEYIDDAEKCEMLINLREKKYVNGGSYKTKQKLLSIQIQIP